MEQNVYGIALTVILLAFFIGIIIRIIKLITGFITEYRKFSLQYDVNVNPSKLTKDHRDVVKAMNTFSYYTHLSKEGKTKFQDRLIKFISKKNFVGMNGCLITDEMRILISATAIQITFGLDIYHLPHFHTIRVYPEIFYLKLMDAELKGGTSPDGVIMLSWDDFQKGHASTDDKINLGLHEMAHAVLLDMLHGTISNRQLEAEIGEWEAAGNVEMEKLRKKSPHFLRSYGGANEHEFFAVCVEHFFEAPAEFSMRLPFVFKRLCRLLNQDPTNARQDYACEQTAIF